jgi:hypothetical protein
MGVSHHDSYTQWKAEGNRYCLESSLTKVGTKWMVNLRPPCKLDGDSDGHGDDDGYLYDELAQTSRSLLETWDLEELDKENEYDGLEDDA